MKKRIKLILYRIGIFISKLVVFRNLKVLRYFWTGFYLSEVECHDPPYILGKPRIIGSNWIKIGANFSALEGLRIEAYNGTNTSNSKKIIIGDNVCFNRNVHIGATNFIRIEENVLVGSNVLITDHNHSTNETGLFSSGTLISKGSVVIGRNSWIGENVCILGGIEIGENSIIGCNTVVTKSIPKNSILVGSGSRIL